MSAVPPLVKKGQPIKADHFNRLAIAVRGLLSMRGGKGVTVTHGRTGIKISLKAAPEYVLPGVITKINSPNGDNATQDLNLVTYDVKIKGRPEFTEFKTLTPMLGRPDLGVDGQPAQVGDDCDLRFRKRGANQEVRLHVFTEKTIHQQCDPEAASGNGQAALVTGLMAEMARLSARLAALEGNGSAFGGSPAAEPAFDGQIGGSDA